MICLSQFIGTALDRVHIHDFNTDRYTMRSSSRAKNKLRSRMVLASILDKDLVLSGPVVVSMASLTKRIEPVDESTFQPRYQDMDENDIGSIRACRDVTYATCKPGMMLVTYLLDELAQFRLRRTKK